MNRSISLISLLGLGVLVGGCPPSSDIVACDPQGCISEKNFANGIVSLLKGSPGVAGYVVTVGGWPSVFSGYAVLSDNPPSSAMLPDDLTNIESISKMLTTFAVLKSLSNHNISLDSPIYPYLYNDWQSVAGLGISPMSLFGQVTFRDLLTHRSGWPCDGCNPAPPEFGCGGGNTSYSTLKAKIQLNTVPIAQGSSGQYSNCNFALLRELLPQMEGNNLSNVLDTGPNNTPRAQKSAQFYIDYVNTNVLSPAGVPSLRNCTPTTNTAFQMFSYPPPNAPNLVPPYQPPLSAVPSTNWGDYFLLCGAGGWNMSAGDLSLLYNALATGALLTPALQAELYNTTNSPNFPGLGWDNTVANCPNAITDGQTYYWCKNGGQGPNSSGDAVETFAGLFKCNAVPVIVVVNSPLPPAYSGNGQITQLVTGAFAATNTTLGAKPCP